ncbi:MAG: hypothetical protein ABFR82_06320 [Nitrospirota bacterium]
MDKESGCGEDIANVGAGLAPARLAMLLQDANLEKKTQNIEHRTSNVE